MNLIRKPEDNRKGKDKDLYKEKESDQLYRNLFDMAPDGIITVNLKGVITSCNPAFLELSGFSKNEIVGTHITTLPTMLKKDLPKSLKLFHFLLKRKATKPIEFRWKRKDGIIRLADVRATLIKKNGRTIGLQAVVRDITEAKRTEEVIRINEEKFRNIFEKANDCLIYLDKSGIILDVNNKSVEVFGSSRSQLIGKNLTKLDFFQHKDIKKLLPSYKKPFADKESTVNVSIENLKGKRRYLECSSTLLKGFERSKNILIIARDATERVQAEEKINEQNVKLKELDKIKTDFLNVTSHELRTPMTSIIGYVQILQKQVLGDVNNEQKKVLDVIRRNANRLDNLIQDILDISRLESGTMKFITKETNIQKMIEETIEIMQSVADSKEIKLNIDIEKKIPNLTIDKDRIKQVLINLINNAIKFTTNKSKINIRAKLEKQDVIFEVQDFGRGIPKSKQNMIFDTFFQVDLKSDRKFGGAGLGLAISRGIVMSHGGKIWVESKEGTGSTFIFTLPIKSIKDIEKRFKEIDIFSHKKNGEN